jgi:nuclear RNA export factor
MDSRITTGGTTLQVDGLKSSKAVSNPDGGLESLLGFLERKAAGLDSASNRAVRIKKVCFLI